MDDLLVELIQLDSTNQFAWQLSENCETAEYMQHTLRLPHSSKNCENLDIYIFSAHPPLFRFTKNIGGYVFLILLLEIKLRLYLLLFRLLGMYVGVIYSLRKYFSKLWKKDMYSIKYDEMVCPDKLLQVNLFYVCTICQLIGLFIF